MRGTLTWDIWECPLGEGAEVGRVGASISRLVGRLSFSFGHCAMAHQIHAIAKHTTTFLLYFCKESLFFFARGPTCKENVHSFQNIVKCECVYSMHHRVVSEFDRVSLGRVRGGYADSPASASSFRG